MAILNYTTKIDADKTASEIAKILSMHGAKAILTEYDDKENYVKFLSFKIVVSGVEMGFRLPTDWKPVLHILNENPKVPARLKTNEQAIRVSWRIIKVWVEAQMALVEIGMVKTEQVFLPYLVGKGGKTLGEKFIENPQLLLK